MTKERIQRVELVLPASGRIADFSYAPSKLVWVIMPVPQCVLYFHAWEVSLSCLLLWLYALGYCRLTSSINTHNFVLVWGSFSGVNKSKFAVCLIFWFELHARWLDWCQIGNLGGDSFGGNPCCWKLWMVLGERVCAVICCDPIVTSEVGR